MAASSWRRLFSKRNYRSLYALFLLMILYTFNSADRFVLGVVSMQVAQALKYGDKGCLKVSTSANSSVDRECGAYKNDSECSNLPQCQWTFTGQGIQYQVLAGPTFIVIFSISALLLGIGVEVKEFNRKNVLAVFAFLWSTSTLLMGFVTEYWQLLVLRMALGLFESVGAPFSASLLSDYFERDLRGAAMGIFNWGIYIGFSLAFVFKFILAKTNWEWVFRTAAIPGCILAVVVALTVKEPPKRTDSLAESVRLSKGSRLLGLAKSFLSPAVFFLCIAGGIRNGGGVVLAYNVDTFFSQYRHANSAHYMSWVPLVGGATGAALGGFISDALVVRFGRQTRVIVLIASQFLAVPLAFGVLTISHPTAAFMCLLVAFFVGEMWIGVCLAVVVELRPKFPTGAASLYIFFVQLIGGNATLLVAPLSNVAGWDLRHALLVLYPGLFAISAVLFCVAFFFIRRDAKKREGGDEDLKQLVGEEEEEEGEESEGQETEASLTPLLQNPVFSSASSSSVN